MNETLLFIGGVFHIGYGIFHIMFWKIFNWKTDLKSLSPINRNVMQVLNLCLTLVFFVFAYISIFHASDMLSTKLGLAMLSSISLFWILRALEQIIFFTLRKSLSWVLFISFLAGSALYAMPAISSF